MSIELNHIIIPARSKWASATFLASILDVPAGPQRDLFASVTVSNGVTFDYVDAEQFGPHRCAFLASEAEFDAAYARIRSTGITYYARPASPAARRDQPPARRPEHLLRRPRRAPYRDHHPALARLRHRAAGIRGPARPARSTPLLPLTREVRRGQRRPILMVGI